jgi:UDP-sugar pyrophosphorylase
LLFQAQPYLEALNECKGIMPEFVNPKYKDDSKQAFKKPTRLECMMQDFPSVLTGSASKRVAFTAITADMCFSPVKNSIEEAVKLQAARTHPACAASGEADQYGASRKILRSLGADITDSAPKVYKGISVVLGPEITISPYAMCCPGEYAEVFTSPKHVHISARSSLVILGKGNLTIESLNLDGALVIDCEEGAEGVVRNLIVKNEGWTRETVDNSGNEILDMRGYRLVVHKTAEVTYKRKTDCVIL